MESRIINTSLVFSSLSFPCGRVSVSVERAAPDNEIRVVIFAGDYGGWFADKGELVATSAGSLSNTKGGVQPVMMGWFARRLVSFSFFLCVYVLVEQFTGLFGHL